MIENALKTNTHTRVKSKRLWAVCIAHKKILTAHTYAHIYIIYMYVDREREREWLETKIGYPTLSFARENIESCSEFSKWMSWMTRRRKNEYTTTMATERRWATKIDKQNWTEIQCRQHHGIPSSSNFKIPHTKLLNNNTEFERKTTKKNRTRAHKVCRNERVSRDC